MIINKTMRTETGHVLFDYAGPCHNLHGHSYKWEIELEGKIKNGMFVVDFSDIKRKINDLYDHKFLIYSYDDLAHKIINMDAINIRGMFLVQFEPTCENIVEHTVKILLQEFGLKRVKIRLWETETSYAEYEEYKS